jgi:hypothetical protein
MEMADPGPVLTPKPSAGMICAAQLHEDELKSGLNPLNHANTNTVPGRDLMYSVLGLL